MKTHPSTEASTEHSNKELAIARIALALQDDHLTSEYAESLADLVERRLLLHLRPPRR
jgi:hypothetical protein